MSYNSGKFKCSLYNVILYSLKKIIFLKDVVKCFLEGENSVFKISYNASNCVKNIWFHLCSKNIILQNKYVKIVNIRQPIIFIFLIFYIS